MKKTNTIKISIYTSLLFLFLGINAQTEDIDYNFNDGLPNDWSATDGWIIEDGCLNLMLNDSTCVETLTTETFNFTDYGSVIVTFPNEVINPDNIPVLIGLFVSTDGGMNYTFVTNILDLANPAVIDLTSLVAGESEVVIQIIAEGCDFFGNFSLKFPGIEMDIKRQNYDIDVADDGEKPGGYVPQQFLNCYPIGVDDTLYISFRNNSTPAIPINVLILSVSTSFFNPNYNISGNLNDIEMRFYDLANNQAIGNPLGFGTFLGSGGLIPTGQYIQLAVPIKFTFPITPINSNDIGQIRQLEIGFDFLEDGIVLAQKTKVFDIQIGNCCEATSINYTNQPLPPFTGVTNRITAQDVTVENYTSNPTPFGVEFQAGNYVDIQGDFLVERGAIFYAHTTPCIQDVLPPSN